MNSGRTPSLTGRDVVRWAGMAATTALAGPLSILASEPRVTTPPYNTLTEEEEIELGRKFSREYESKVEILANPMIDAYLADTVEKLGKASQRPQWPYSLKVVNSSIVNASAIPGGFLYLHRGLLEFVIDENEMVGAIAHEIGHVVARHTTNQLMLTLTSRHLYETVKKNILLDNEVIASLIEQLGGPVVLQAQLRYSRANESEADMLGFYEMLRAGWHPNGLLKFFVRLQQQEGTRNPVEVMLSDHPASEDRARAIREELGSVEITTPMREQTFQFQALKLALSLIPPAPRTPRS